MGLNKIENNFFNKKTRPKQHIQITIQGLKCTVSFYDIYDNTYDYKVDYCGLDYYFIIRSNSDKLESQIKQKKLKTIKYELKEKNWESIYQNQIIEPQPIKGYLVYIDPRLFVIPNKPNIHDISNYDKQERALKSYEKQKEIALEKIRTKVSLIFEKFAEYTFYIYKNTLYYFTTNEYEIERQKLLIKDNYFKQEKKFQKLQKEIRLFEKLESSEIPLSREPIPEDVKFIVWRRDLGKCVKCGSNKKLEFDHIIPISEGGSNSERNIQLLCERCNREKSNKI
jgi:hypothetical protein